MDQSNSTNLLFLCSGNSSSPWENLTWQQVHAFHFWKLALPYLSIALTFITVSQKWYHFFNIMWREMLQVSAMIYDWTDHQAVSTDYMTSTYTLTTHKKGYWSFLTLLAYSAITGLIDQRLVAVHPKSHIMSVTVHIGPGEKASSQFDLTLIRRL